MGAQFCYHAASKTPLETLRFHAEAKGAQVRLDSQGSIASRCATFHDGIVFSQRPVLPREPVTVRVLRHEKQWQGGLRVGFTRLDPAHVPASSLPPYVCPDLVQQSPTWAAVVPECFVLEGNVVSFWFSRHGWLLAEVNAEPPIVLRRDVAMGAPLWAVMDVYGTTKAIELLDNTLPRTMPSVLSGDFLRDPKDTAGQECAVCFHDAANTYLVPCGHSDFCYHCAWRVFRETAKCPICRWKIEDVARLHLC
ncbi:E3 ubiquitin-protein ligase NEURL3 [Erinaceus europaeus]|uniref:E3 ubiquitin-protein ligase NEURL3 n=1 Tax=Erinaceus europaeus TaxID=9365 RepID=A0A1S3WBP5_ERIEU|nr:E3 ubiquitin-protein ligase NEURL3 [Erinaceus europaeus]